MVIASVREERVGLPIAQWFIERAAARKFDVEVVDLKAIDLPVAPNAIIHACRSTRTEAKEWSAVVAALDAFVLVTPEYNFSVSPPPERVRLSLCGWNYKPAAFVSYGGYRAACAPCRRPDRRWRR